jgi:hypothetical protein
MDGKHSDVEKKMKGGQGVDHEFILHKENEFKMLVFAQA